MQAATLLKVKVKAREELTVETLVLPQLPPQLRPYQVGVVNGVYSNIRQGHKRILCVAPTGSGKTIIASQIVAHAVTRRRRILFIMHRDGLIAQTAAKFHSFGIDCGFIKAGWQENREALVQVASVQTLPRRKWWQEFLADVIVLDEAHLVGWAKVVQQMMKRTYPQAIYLGLTATPWRLNKQQGMGDIFSKLVCAPLPHELIDQGFLVKPCYYSLGEADLEKVGTVAGEYDEGELAIVCDRPELIARAVEDWKRLANSRRTIAFAVNVQHSRHICEAFQGAGIPAAHVDGTTPIKVPQQIYEQLASGAILVLSSCGALTEGFDVPGVSAVLLGRPTKSKALYFQQLGRGLRLSPETDKRDCVVLDQAGNVARFGYIEALKQVTLNPGKKPGDTSGAMKVCPISEGGCGAILYAFHMRCTECGYHFPSHKVALLAGLKQQLSEEDVERLEFYRSLMQEAYACNFAPGWAAVHFRDQFGHWPPDAWALGAVFGNSPTEANRQSYREYLTKVARRKEKPESWINSYMVMEFGWQEPPQKQQLDQLVCRDTKS